VAKNGSTDLLAVPEPFGPEDENTASQYYEHEGITYTGKCSPGANDLNWRLALLIGAIPGILLLPFKVSETSNVVKDPTRKSTFWADLGRREYWPKLLGTAGGWFFFDIVFYGNSLFAPIVTSAVFKGDFDIAQTASHNAIVFLIALPGYWIATIFMDKLGRKNIQMMGFFMMTLLFGMLAFLLDKKEQPKMKAHPALLLFLYGMTFFFANFGPNSTTFILPSETYPQECRSSLNGFSAACGKLGAAIGSYGFKPLSVAYGIPVVRSSVCVCVCACVRACVRVCARVAISPSLSHTTLPAFSNYPLHEACVIDPTWCARARVPPPPLPPFCNQPLPLTHFIGAW
jgi:MFS family permease